MCLINKETGIQEEQMRKRISSIISMVLILCCLFCGTLQAEETGLKQVDGSYLTTQDSSEGSTNNNFLRGEHLMDGECSISKAGIGKIYVYGATTANHDVDYVSVSIYVDQYNEALDEWEQINYWSVEDENTYYVSDGKAMAVDRGYYYRVRCYHMAGNNDQLPYDSTVSFTDGIFVP